MATGTYTPGSNDILHTVEVNLESRELIPTPVHIVQYDKKLPILEVLLYKGNSPYVVPSGATVSIRFRKPDEKVVYNPAIGLNSNRTIVYFQVTYQMSSKDGDALAIVEVDLGSTGSGGSGAFRVIVERNPVQDGDIISTDEMLNIQGYVDQAKKYADAAKYTIQVGTVTTGNPGTPAKVVNRGTAQNAVLDFTIPRGLDGSLDDPSALLGGDVWLSQGGTALKSGDNLNDYKNVGNYYCLTQAICKTLLNNPISIEHSGPFFMKVISPDASKTGIRLQIIWSYWYGNIIIGRYYDGSAYGEWKRAGHDLINNMTTTISGKGALDASVGHELKDWIDHYHYGTRIEFQTTQEMIQYLDSYSADIENYTSYKFNVKSAELILPFSGIVWTVEGYKHNTSYEYQVLRSYGSNFPEIVRRKYSGTWTQHIVAEQDYLEKNYLSLTQFIDIPENADMKSSAYLVPGNYACKQNAIGSSLINSPLSKAFTLTVFYANGASNYIMQEFKSIDGDVVVLRMYSTSTKNWGSEKYYYGNTSLDYSDGETIESISIPTNGYFSLSSNFPNDKNYLFATIRTYGNADRSFNVYATNRSGYIFGEPGTIIKNLRVRYWYYK